MTITGVFKRTWPLILEESETRAFNIFNFIEKYNIFGEELWENLFPKIESEFKIKSEKLKLKGVIDQIEKYQNGYVPVELKTGKAPKEGIWPGHRIQLGAYALLLEDFFKVPIKEGFINYLDTKEKRHLSINPFLKDEIIDLRNKVSALMSNNEIPAFCGNENKCNVCGLKEQCYNNKLMTKKLKILN